MPKRVVFFIGSPGVGKSTLSALLLGMMNVFNVNKDVLAESRDSSREKVFSKYIRQLFSESEEWLYDAVLRQVYYQLRGGNSTVIAEGNWGKRLSKEKLEKIFGDLNLYDFCLVHVTCSNPEVQYQRVMDRGEAKDKTIISNKKAFLKYREIRMAEERTCIEAMKSYMRIIPVENNSILNTDQLSQLAMRVKLQIEGTAREFYELSTLPKISAVVRSKFVPHSTEEDDIQINQVFVADQKPSNPEVTSFRILRTESVDYHSPVKTSPGLKSVNNISPPKHPLLPSSMPPEFKLDTERHQSVTSQNEMYSVNFRHSRKGSSSPFLSFSGRVKDKSGHEPFDKDEISGRKSPRWSDDWGRPIASRNEEIVVPITVRPLYNA